MTKEKLANEKLKSQRRSSVGLNSSHSTETETFDYDTSDSIEEDLEVEDEEVEEIASVKSRSSNRVVLDDLEEEILPENVPNRKARQSSVGGRYSMVSNVTLESSIGGV